jgi:hypothetical protein
MRSGVIFAENPSSQDLIDALRDLEDVFRRISGRNERILDYLDDQDGLLPDDERDGCVTDAEAVRNDTNNLLQRIAQTILWLKLNGN